MTIKKIIIVSFFLSISLLGSSIFTQKAEAVTGAIYGRVWMYDTWGNLVYLPGVKIYRKDNFDYLNPSQFRVSLDERLNDPNLSTWTPDQIRGTYRSYKGGVETTSTDDGYWYYGPNHPPYEKGNGKYYDIPSTITWWGFGPGYPSADMSLIPLNNDPVPVENSAGEICKGSNQALCPTGPQGNVSTFGANCGNLNYCGLNCLETPHAYRAYFPPGYTYIDKYFGGSVEFDPADPKGGGRFIAFAAKFPYKPLGPQGYKSYLLQDEVFSEGVSQWDDYEGKEYYVVDSYNNRYTGPYDFIWYPGKGVSNTPPNIESVVPTNDSPWIGTATNDDNGYYCEDNNPYEYEAHITDANGSKDVDVIEFNLQEFPFFDPNDNSTWLSWHEQTTEKRWPLRITFAQKWVGQAGREFAENTFFVRDRDVKEWNSDKCFTNNRSKVDVSPTGWTYPLNAGNIEPRKNTNYSLSCYGYDNHSWVDAIRSPGNIDGHQVDMYELPDKISIYNSGFRAELLEKSFVAYSKDSNDVWVNFKVKFIGEDVQTDWKYNSEFRNLWRVVDLKREQDKTHNVSNNNLYTEYIQGNYYHYYHVYGNSRFDMLPPSVTIEESTPSNVGNTYDLPWTAVDNESGLYSVQGEMLIEGASPSPITNQTSKYDKDTASSYKPWPESGPIASGNQGAIQCTLHSECPQGSYCDDLITETCKVECKTNADCEVGTDCIFDGTHNRCNPSTAIPTPIYCDNDFDCPVGNYCNIGAGTNGPGECESYNECEIDSDCSRGYRCLSKIPCTPDMNCSSYKKCGSGMGVIGGTNCNYNYDCMPYACKLYPGTTMRCTNTCSTDQDCAGYVDTDGDGTDDKYFICDVSQYECKELKGWSNTQETDDTIAAVLGANAGDFTYYVKESTKVMDKSKGGFKPIFLWNEMGPTQTGIGQNKISRVEVLDVGNNITNNQTTVNIQLFGGAVDNACNLSQNPSSTNFISYDPWFSSRGGMLFSESISADIAVTRFDDPIETFSSSKPFNNPPFNFERYEVALSSEWLGIGPTGNFIDKHKINQSNVEFFSSNPYEDNNNVEHFKIFRELAVKKSTKSPSVLKVVPYSSASIDNDSQLATICNQTPDEIKNGQLCVINVPNSLTITDDSHQFNCSNIRAYIFVEGDLTVNRNIVSSPSGDKGCLFSVAKDVTINPEYFTSYDNQYDPNSVKYNELNTLIMADGRINIVNSAELYGLIVQGGLISMGGDSSNPSITLNRSIPMKLSKDFPTYLFQWDPRYVHMARSIFAKEDYDAESEIGYQN